MELPIRFREASVGDKLDSTQPGTSSVYNLPPTLTSQFLNRKVIESQEMY